MRLVPKCFSHDAVQCAGNESQAASCRSEKPNHAFGNLVNSSCDAVSGKEPRHTSKRSNLPFSFASKRETETTAEDRIEAALKTWIKSASRDSDAVASRLEKGPSHENPRLRRGYRDCIIAEDAPSDKHIDVRYKPDGGRRVLARRLMEIFQNRDAVLDLTKRTIISFPECLHEYAHLEKLVVDSRFLPRLPQLPPNLKVLKLQCAILDELPALPAGLEILDVGFSGLRKLPVLPETLLRLDVSHTHLTELPALPATLRRLDASYTPLKELPTLPQGLTNLQVDSSGLTALPVLPASVRSISARSCHFSPLPAIPHTVKEVDLACSGVDPEAKRELDIMFPWYGSFPMNMFRDLQVRRPELFVGGTPPALIPGPVLRPLPDPALGAWNVDDLKPV